MNKKVYCADLTHTGNGTMALTFPLVASYVVSYAKKILGAKYPLNPSMNITKLKKIIK